MSLDPVRTDWNRAVLRRYGLDAVVCRLPENVLVLTGYWPVSSFAFALFPVEGPVTLIPAITEVEEIADGTVDDVRPFKYGELGAPDPYQAIQRYLAAAMAEAGLSRGTIGVEMGFETVAPGHTAAEVYVPASATLSAIASAVPNATVVDATTALYETRARKTPSELARLRLANEIAAFGLRAFRESFEPGRSEAAGA